MHGRAERPAGHGKRIEQAQKSPQSSPLPFNKGRKTSNVIGGAQGEAGGTGEGVPMTRFARIGPSFEIPASRVPIAGVTAEIEQVRMAVWQQRLRLALVDRVISSISAANRAEHLFHSNPRDCQKCATC
jgi:hypothetical protein